MQGFHSDEEDEEIKEIRFIRAMAETTRVEMAVVQEIIKRFDALLLVMEKKLASHEKVIYIGMGVIIAMQFLSGSGVISLKGLVGK